MDIDIDYLRTWIGRTEEKTDIITPTLAERFLATLEAKGPITEGAQAPLMIHFCLGQPALHMEALGRDGHPKLGSFLPPVPLPRRMWAGGTITFFDDMHIGETITRHSTIADVVTKQGRTGPLCFITVQHRYLSRNQVLIEERQNLVYREDVQNTPAKGGSTLPSPPPKAARKGTISQQLTPNPTLLFRYSALTFNGHRIHYDRPYAETIEGYPGLVVHGPMLASLLARLAAETMGMRPQTFTFRSTSTIFDTHDIVLSAERDSDTDNKTLQLWAAQGGQEAMTATATW